VETRKTETIYIMAVISTGVCIASYGTRARAHAQTHTLRKRIAHSRHAAARPLAARIAAARSRRRLTRTRGRPCAGELAFVLTGVLFQLGSIVSESNRIVLVQILLQSKGVKLNPVTSMYYILPCCFVFLIVPWAAIEYPRLAAASDGRVWLDANGMFIFITNAMAAFTLNCSVFLLIGKSSALTMNIAGVVKDWMLIYLSWLIFAGPITPLNLIGYSIAFVAVCWYNYVKLRAMNVETAKKEGERLPEGSEEGGDAEKGGGEKGLPAPPLSIGAPGEKDKELKA
jgi:hypothetical protein